mmetsp:Transcript_29199/g.67703  ORF Transcript_29199/g.67703 Transcript_29199/m.67703 type:complete len:93 (+) Transcript_29199:1322-1600(+)
MFSAQDILKQCNCRYFFDSHCDKTRENDIPLSICAENHIPSHFAYLPSSPRCNPSPTSGKPVRHSLDMFQMANVFQGVDLPSRIWRVPGRKR